MFCRWQIKSGTVANIFQPQCEQPDVKKIKKHLNLMRYVKGVYVLSFNNVSRKTRFIITRLLQGNVPPLEFSIAVRPKQGANFRFYPFPSLIP